jgi:hypothetical protein
MTSPHATRRIRHLHDVIAVDDKSDQATVAPGNGYMPHPRIIISALSLVPLSEKRGKLHHHGQSHPIKRLLLLLLLQFSVTNG